MIFLRFEFLNEFSVRNQRFRDSRNTLSGVLGDSSIIIKRNVFSRGPAGEGSTAREADDGFGGVPHHTRCILR